MIGVLKTSSGSTLWVLHRSPGRRRPLRGWAIPAGRSRQEPLMFDGFDPVTLARAQFAFTMSFHIVFPAFSIGLASYLATLEALWLWTGRSVYLDLFKYWLKIFAIG